MTISNEAIAGYLHTPTLEEVRQAATSFDFAWEDGGAAFDRWLAARDAAIEARAKVEALRGVADAAFKDKGIPGLQRTLIGTWLRARADQIDGGNK